ncbi:OstA-like protein [Hymenobacter caeli]|uniref:Lipopolysaccharide export system protein LptA n=1 Tax=Hymenobacter caeli TaxID=2735894 RepID=A0ABX2FLJ8_9BACT|nr:OstA-like protein [Hymenobacter caeli]NRT17329.1 lipopolysaccharide export system protein LptA [Hymenobacter caeli]
MPRFRFFILLLLLLPALARAQRPAVGPGPPKPVAKGTPVELLKGAGTLVGMTTPEGVKIRKVLGNVGFKQGDTFLYCDSAYQYLDRNEIEAFSNVRVIQNDTVTINGDHGYYNGNLRTARMVGNVVMHDPRMTLTTPTLNYDLNRKTATYLETGHLTDPQNTLDSQQGFYDTNSKVFVFKRDVHLVSIDPKNGPTDLTNDTLTYNTISKIAYFDGPTRIKGSQGNLYAEKGNYNTFTRVSNFEKNAKIDTPNYLLGGDKLVYDEATLYGVAAGHVTLISKKDNIALRGDFGRLWRALGRTKLYGGRPVVRSISDKDTLYMAADTLLSVEARPGRANVRPVLYAYPKVQIFKANLQGRCDSLTYDRQDSIIYLNRDPVLWQAHTQMRADSMEIIQKRGKIDQMRLYANSFVINQDTLLDFNQIKGRNILAYFRNGQIGRIDVLGNAESIAYALDGDTAVTGMNKGVSATMRMRFAENKLQKITMLVNPDANFIPLHEIKEPDTRLKGFNWRPTERPTRRQVLGKQFDDRPRRKTKAKAKAKPVRKKSSTRPRAKTKQVARPPAQAAPPKPAKPAPPAPKPVVARP